MTRPTLPIPSGPTPARVTACARLVLRTYCLSRRFDLRQGMIVAHKGPTQMRLTDRAGWRRKSSRMRSAASTPASSTMGCSGSPASLGPEATDERWLANLPVKSHRPSLRHPRAQFSQTLNRRLERTGPVEPHDPWLASRDVSPGLISDRSLHWSDALVGCHNRQATGRLSEPQNIEPIPDRDAAIFWSIAKLEEIFALCAVDCETRHGGTRANHVLTPLPLSPFFMQNIERLTLTLQAPSFKAPPHTRSRSPHPKTRRRYQTKTGNLLRPRHAPGYLKDTL